MTDEKRNQNIARYRRYEKLRIERGKKDADVAKATGISAATLSSWKKGVYTPGYSRVMKIAEYLSVPASAFEYDGDGHENRVKQLEEKVERVEAGVLEMYKIQKELIDCVLAHHKQSELKLATLIAICAEQQEGGVTH